MAKNDTKINSLFKSLLGREHTSNLKEWYEELSNNVKFIHSTEVFIDQIPETPPIDSTGVIHCLNKYQLTEISSVSGHRAWRLKTDPNDQNSNPITFLVHPRFGQGYNVKLYDANDTEIPATSPVEWLFFYETGILVFEEDPTTHGYTLPLKIDTYRYIGKHGDQLISESPISSPIIDSIEWDNETHYEDNEYTVTINAHDPQGFSLSYEIINDSPNSSIIQDTDNKNIFHIRYPSYDGTVEIKYVIVVTNIWGYSTTQTFTKTVQNITDYSPPIINSIHWNVYNHREQNTYELVIGAFDQNGLDLTYQVTCNDPSVSIVQNPSEDYVFSVTYGEYSEPRKITYTIIVSNTESLKSTRLSYIEVKPIKDPAFPVINNISWDNSSHEGNSSYILTISAEDPKSLDLTYQVTCDDPDVTVTQDTTDENKFHITYPDYTENNVVLYHIVVTNENDSRSELFESKYINSVSSPVISGIEWESFPVKTENSPIDLTIQATDPNGLNLSYSVVCSDSNVTIEQDTNNLNVFHITFPTSIRKDSTIFFKTLVTNEKGVSSFYSFWQVIDSGDRKKPIIISTGFESTLHYMGNVYDVSITADGVSSNIQSYSVTTQHPDVTIEQDTNNENIFHITYNVRHELVYNVDFKIEVVNEDGLRDISFITKQVYQYFPPIIKGFLWNNISHHENNSYTITIDAYDIENLPLEYSVTCDDANVTIEQDTTDENVFHVTYPEYENDKEIVYSIGVKNNQGLIANNTFPMSIIHEGDYKFPVINNITWNSKRQYKQQQYTITIDATDPNNHELIYELSCMDQNVIISQDVVNANIFYITYPDYMEDTIVELMVSVISSDNGLTTVRKEEIEVLYWREGIPSTVDYVEWDNHNHRDQETYVMTIHTDDPYNDFDSLSFSVTPSDENITIEQDVTNKNVFHITYPEYSKDSIQNFVISITNKKGINSTFNENVIIKPYLPPVINDITWDNELHQSLGTYRLSIDAVDPNGLDLEYSIQPNPDDISIQPISDGEFNITYSHYIYSTEGIFTITVKNEKNKSVTKNIKTYVNRLPEPIILGISWNTLDQFECKSYILTIDAIDLFNRKMSYRVTSDIQNVSIIQDRYIPYKFFINYPIFLQNTDIVFTIEVTNSLGYMATSISQITVSDYQSSNTYFNKIDDRFPVIDDIPLNDQYYYPGSTYQVDIQAHDPYGSDLSYDLYTNEPSIVINRLGDGSSFLINIRIQPNDQKRFSKNELALITATVTNEKGFSVTKTKEIIIVTGSSPYIDYIEWDSNKHIEGGTYYATVHSHRGTTINQKTRIKDIYLKCDDPNVSINYIDAPDEYSRRFKVKYPIYSNPKDSNFDYPFVNFIVIGFDYSEGHKIPTTKTFRKKIYKHKKPKINYIKWNDTSHLTEHTYDLTINAVDPQDFDLTYGLVCNDPNVNVIQDISSPFVFHVTYPYYFQDTDITFTITVTNSVMASEQIQNIKTVNGYGTPLIQGINWEGNISSENDGHYPNTSYRLVISSIDPNGLHLSYQVICDNSDVTITQDTFDENVFHITYPSNIVVGSTVNYTITVTNSDNKSSIKTETIVISKCFPPNISVEWNDDDQYKLKTYDLIIHSDSECNQNFTYELVCNDNSITIEQNVGNPNIFHVTYPNYISDIVITYVATVTDSTGAYNEITFKQLVKKAAPPIINDVTWNTQNQWDSHTYTLTIDATDPQDDILYFYLTCNDPGVLIVQKGNQRVNSFDISYPNLSSDTTYTFTAKVVNLSNLSDESSINQLVHAEVNPVIDSISWNESTHIEKNSYTLTITAHDPNNKNLTFTVTCNNSSVGITQDTTDENVFHVTYGDFRYSEDIEYTIRVTNTDSLFDEVIDRRHIIAVIPPEINRVSWSSDLLIEHSLYDITIDAIDPNGLDISYEIIPDDISINIEQDTTNENKFHITYPNYDSNKEVSHVIVVKNSETEVTPVIDNISWDQDNHSENNSYTLTITAHDLNSLDLSYQVTCDNSDVTIEQDTTDENVFHITYPIFNENTSVTYMVRVMNTNDETSYITDTKNVEAEDFPVINSISWNSSNHKERASYDLTIDATDPNNRPLTYQVTCDDSNVTIEQDTNNLNVFHVTYPDYSASVVVIFTITVTNNYGNYSTQTEKKIVESRPIKPVSSILWDNLVQYEGEGPYTITITPGGSFSNPISYTFTSPEPEINITQDTTDENKFHVTYGVYFRRKFVEFNLHVEDVNYNECNVDLKEVVNIFPHGDLMVMVGGWGPSGGTDTMDQITLTTPGNATSFGSYSEPVSTITGYFSNGLDERGVLGGTMNTNTNNIISNKYITINSPGNALYFGENIVVEKENSGVSNNKNQRGVFMAGIDQSGNYLQSMGYVTINIIGNATNFGQLLYSRAFSRSASNGINDRGIMAAGVTTTSFLNNIEYITISTPGNSTNFGGLATNTKAPSSFSNGLHDRAMLISGGINLNDWYSYTGDMQYLTITTPGNAILFDTTTRKSSGTGGSNGTGEIGVISGGWEGSHHLSDIVTYKIDILSSGTYFGELTVARDAAMLCDA